MTVKEIIAMELANTNSIYMLREGMFYRAYNQSAMRMVLHLKAFKVNHKYVKTVQQEIFYVGFPFGSLVSIQQLAIEKGWQLVESSGSDNEAGKMIVIQAVLGVQEDYQAWVDKQLQPFNGFKPFVGCTKGDAESNQVKELKTEYVRSATTSCAPNELQDAVFDKQTNCVFKSILFSLTLLECLHPKEF